MRRQFPQEQEAWLEDIFEGLDEATAWNLRYAGEEIYLNPGEPLSAVQNAVIRVESGLLKLSVISTDRSIAVALFGPGDTICAPLFHNWDPHIYQIQAQESSELRILPQEAVLKVAAENPEFSRRLMRQLSWGTWHLMQTIHMLEFHNLPQRVAQVLLNLAEMFGRPDDRKRGVRLGLRLTQEELAELAGARRETLSTILQDFRSDEILDLRYARIDIRDMDALRKLAGTEPLPFLKSAGKNGSNGRANGTHE